MTYPQGLVAIAKSLKDAGIKVIVVLVGDEDKGLDNVRPLASGKDFILAVGSPDRLKVMVQPTVDKIMQGNLYNAEKDCLIDIQFKVCAVESLIIGHSYDHSSV